MYQVLVALPICSSKDTTSGIATVIGALFGLTHGMQVILQDPCGLHRSSGELNGEMIEAMNPATFRSLMMA